MVLFAPIRKCRRTISKVNRDESGLIFSMFFNYAEGI